MYYLALCMQLKRVGCGLHRGTSQPESPRATKPWGQGGTIGYPLRCKTLFSPFLYCVSSGSLFSNSLGKGFLEDQSTYISSVSIRAIFSKTFPHELATWVSEQHKGKELLPKIKTWDIKKVLPEWILRQLFMETYTSHCNWNIASSCVWANNTSLVRSVMSLCEVGLVGLHWAPHSSASPSAWPVKRPRNKRDKS